jgi:hypothetical protein
MKSILIASLLTLSLQAYDIKISKSFEQEVAPDMMQLSFHIASRANDASSVRKVLNGVVKKINASEFCAPATYSIAPLYNYESKTREFLGMHGDLYTECTFVEAKEVDSFIHSLEREKKLELTISPIRWIVNKKLQVSAKSALEIKAMHFAKEYVTTLESQGIGGCSVTQIELASSAGVHYRSEPLMSQAKSVGTEAPRKEPMRVSVHANYTFSCK